MGAKENPMIEHCIPPALFPVSIRPPLSIQIETARQILVDAIRQFNPKAVIGLYSGGNDSTVAMHLTRDLLTHAAHIVTGIGIPSTTEFVHEQCRVLLDVPLIELVTPPEVYEKLLFQIRSGHIQGFPGPSAHNVAYYYLKQKRLRELRGMFIKDNRKDRVIFVNGIRSHESARRARRALSCPIRREGSIIWVQPILNFDSQTMLDYRRAFDIPQCEASALLHRSGECLCGAFARSGELEEIELWFPEMGAYIRTLEDRLKAADAKNCKWGGSGTGHKRGKDPGPLCSDCIQYELEFSRA